jgi:hypothetical protein
MSREDPNGQPTKVFPGGSERRDSAPASGDAQPPEPGGDNAEPREPRADITQCLEPGAAGERGFRLEAVAPFPEPDPLRGALLEASEREDLRLRWSDIQESFVDDPKLAVANADELVGEAIRWLSAMFHNKRHSLEQEWGDEAGGVSTEQLRQTLKHYRSFFEEILQG